MSEKCAAEVWPAASGHGTYRCTRRAAETLEAHGTQRFGVCWQHKKAALRVGLWLFGDYKLAMWYSRLTLRVVA